MPWLKRLGKIQKRFSYASWTSPSHLTYLMGQLPHDSPKRTFASRAYQKELLLWGDRLGIPKLRFNEFLPELSLPKMLKTYGYRSEAMVSMPVLNPTTPMSRFFDRYRLMPSHNDFGAIVDQLSFKGSTPRFYFLNVGETHYPYALAGEKENELPHLHGLHGTFKHMDDGFSGAMKKPKERFFSKKELLSMKNKQIDCLEHLDEHLKRVFDKCPSNTHFIITSDHGELFGEDGFFGHGPIFHEKVFEVPLVEGRIR
jgi:hypothetical protein